MADFQPAVTYVLANEGSAYTNDPDDRGGPTRWGITQTMLAKWRNGAVTPDDVQALTQDEATRIYQAFFWSPLHLGEINPQGVATALLDAAVNLGASRGVSLAQRITGNTADGILGPGTIARLNAGDARLFLTLYLAALQDHAVACVVAAPDQLRFLKGWLSRARRLISLFP